MPILQASLRITFGRWSIRFDRSSLGSEKGDRRQIGSRRSRNFARKQTFIFEICAILAKLSYSRQFSADLRRYFTINLLFIKNIFNFFQILTASAWDCQTLKSLTKTSPDFRKCKKCFSRLSNQEGWKNSKTLGASGLF